LTEFGEHAIVRPALGGVSTDGMDARIAVAVERTTVRCLGRLRSEPIVGLLRPARSP